MRDVLTAADLDAILRGGGSVEDKLQRAANMTWQKLIVRGSDLLTLDECAALCIVARMEPRTMGMVTAFQRAARLGAEREREKFIPKLLAMRDAIIHDDHAEAWHKLYSLADPNPAPGKEPWAEWEQIAEAIRRGEEGICVKSWSSEKVDCIVKKMDEMSDLLSELRRKESGEEG